VHVEAEEDRAKLGSLDDLQVRIRRHPLNVLEGMEMVASMAPDRSDDVRVASDLIGVKTTSVRLC